MGIKSFQGARKQQQNSTLDAPFKVSDYMTRNLITFKPEQSVEEVIESLINNRISGGPVVNSAGCVVGVVTSKHGESEGLAFAISAQRLIDFNTSGIISPQPQQAEKDSKKATKPPTSQVCICSFNSRKEECDIGFDGDSSVIVLFSSDGKVVRYHFGEDQVQIIEDNGRISTGTYSKVGRQVIIYSSNGNTTVIPLTQS